MADLSLLVPDHAALGEDIRPVAHPFEGAGDHLLRVAEPIDGGRVDPVDAVVKRFSDRGHGGVIVLAAPPREGRGRWAAAVSTRWRLWPALPRTAAAEPPPPGPPRGTPHPKPPMAQAPKPIRVMCRSEFPNCLVCMVASFSAKSWDAT